MIDPSKSTPRGGLSPRPLGALTVRTPMARIVVLGVLLLLVIFGMVFLNQYAGTPAARERPTDSPAIVVKREAFEGVPALDMAVAEQLTDYGPDARRRWPEEALRYLLLEAANTPAVVAYEKNLLPVTPGSAAEIGKDSRPWRFKYVRFRGELEYLREEAHESGPVWRGRVRVSDGEPPVRVVFVTVLQPTWFDPNESGPSETMPIRDGWVRGRGILVQNYVDEPGGDVPALLVVATKVERDYEPVTVASLEDVPFDIIEDDPAIAAEEGGRATLGKEYPRPLFRLVKYAEGLAGGAGAAARAEKGLKAQRLATRKAWEELVGQASKFRAQYYGGLGIIALSPGRYFPETITPNDAGVEECLNGWIYTDEGKLLQFVAPASLDGEWKERTRIRWEGFFYKTKLYQSNDGADRLAPVFVLTVLDEVKAPKSGSLFPVLLAGSVVLGMALLAWIVLREDGTKESYRRIRQKKIAAGRAAE